MPKKKKLPTTKKKRKSGNSLKLKAKKPASRSKKPAARAKKPAPVGKKRAPAENIVGVVTHYFPKINAAAIKIKAPISIGAIVKIKGHTTDFTQTIASMQLDHVPIVTAKKKQEIGIIVSSRVRRRDKVILI